jgi:hypothetical protein
MVVINNVLQPSDTKTHSIISSQNFGLTDLMVLKWSMDNKETRYQQDFAPFSSML